MRIISFFLFLTISIPNIATSDEWQHQYNIKLPNLGFLRDLSFYDAMQVGKTGQILRFSASEGRRLPFGKKIISIDWDFKNNRHYETTTVGRKFDTSGTISLSHEGLPRILIAGSCTRLYDSESGEIEGFGHTSKVTLHTHKPANTTLGSGSMVLRPKTIGEYSGTPFKTKERSSSGGSEWTLTKRYNSAAGREIDSELSAYDYRRCGHRSSRRLYDDKFIVQGGKSLFFYDGESMTSTELEFSGDRNAIDDVFENGFLAFFEGEDTVVVSGRRCFLSISNDGDEAIAYGICQKGKALNLFPSGRAGAWLSGDFESHHLPYSSFKNAVQKIFAHHSKDLIRKLAGDSVPSTYDSESIFLSSSGIESYPFVIKKSAEQSWHLRDRDVILSDRDEILVLQENRLVSRATIDRDVHSYDSMVALPDGSTLVFYSKGENVRPKVFRLFSN